MSSPEINPSSTAHLILDGVRVDTVNFTVEHSPLLGMVAVFPNNVPPLARLFIATTNDTYQKTFEETDEKGAMPLTQPHEIVEFIRECIHGSVAASALLVLSADEWQS